MLLDEPTAALGVPQTKQVLALIKRLKERGLGVVVISHNLADVFEVCDRVFVLRLGKAGRGLQGRRDHRAGDRRRHHRRAKHGRRGAGMSAAADTTVTPDAERAHRAGRSCAASWRATSPRCGCVLVLAVIWIIFQSQNDRFLSAVNLTNLMLQITAVGLISVGIVYVLLLGEIDLSVGAVSGLAAAVMAVLNVKHGWNPYLAIAAGVATGTAIGLIQGAIFTRFGVPSFVVTLAGLLAWQGALLYVLGDTGTVNLNDAKITGLANTFYSDSVGWIMAFVLIGSYAGASLWGYRQRVKAGLADTALAPVVIRVVGGGGVRARGCLGPQLGPRRAAGAADPARLRRRRAVRGHADDVRAPRVRRRRQRRGRAARRHQRDPDPRDGVRRSRAAWRRSAASSRPRGCSP